MKGKYIYVIFPGIGKSTLAKSKPNDFCNPTFNLFTDKDELINWTINNWLNIDKILLISINDYILKELSKYKLPLIVILPDESIIPNIKKQIETRKTCKRNDSSFLDDGTYLSNLKDLCKELNLNTYIIKNSDYNLEQLIYELEDNYEQI